jgi:DNA polymerase III sliding clamp (beta) subunit (PCNA family)
MNELEVLQKIIAFSENVSCKDATRYSLQGVCLRLKEETLLVVATDGHRMIQEQGMCPDSLRETMNKMNKKEIIVSNENIKMLKLFMKGQVKGSNYSFQQVVNVDNNNQQKNALVLRNMGNILILELIDCEYPNTDQIVKGLKTPTHKISFNAEYLYKLSKAMKKDSVVVLEMNLNEELAPITINHENTLGVLMPCRV